MKEIDIMDFLKILLKKAWIIALVAVLCAAIGFSYCTLMVTPEYSSKAVMVVTVGDMTSDIVDSKDYAVVLSMMPTYVAQLREGTDFYKTIADSVNYSYKKESAEEYSAAKIKSMCTWSFTEEQLHATVVVTGTNQNDVQLILEAIDKNADNYLKSVFPTTITKSTSRSEKASHTYPSTMIFALGGFLIGAVISAVIIYLVEALNTKIKSEEELIAQGFTVLGTVPDLNEIQRGGAYRE